MKQRIEDLGSWIAEYSAARAPRGASTFPSRDTAAAAIAHFDRIEEEPGHEFIDRQFVTLRPIIGRVYSPTTDGADRSYIVMTSKFLWSRFPDRTPIYDANAVASARFLVKVLKSELRPGPYRDEVERAATWNLTLDPLAPQGDAYDVNNRLHEDGWYFRDFHASHRALFRRFQVEVEKKLIEKKCGGRPELAYRVFDKILWILGEMQSDYSLKGDPPIF